MSVIISTIMRSSALRKTFEEQPETEGPKSAMDRLRSALCKASQFIRQLGKGRPRNDVSDLPLQIDDDDVCDQTNPIDSDDVVIDQDPEQIRSGWIDYVGFDKDPMGKADVTLRQQRPIYPVSSHQRNQNGGAPSPKAKGCGFGCALRKSSKRLRSLRHARKLKQEEGDLLAPSLAAALRQLHDPKALKSPGLLRKPGERKRVKVLIKRAVKNKKIRWQSEHPDTISSFVQELYHRYPGGVVPEALWTTTTAGGEPLALDPARLWSGLDKAQSAMLTALLDLGRAVVGHSDLNFMTACNVAMVLSPILIASLDTEHQLHMIPLASALFLVLLASDGTSTT